MPKYRSQLLIKRLVLDLIFKAKLMEMAPPSMIFVNFNLPFGIVFLRAQIGAPQTLSDVLVTDGLFNVMLNDAGQFGRSAFTGEYVLTGGGEMPSRW